MGDISLDLMLYTKVIHYQLKLKEPCLVPPQAGSNGCCIISKFGHIFLQFIVGNISCLGHSIHSFLDFHIQKYFVC